MNDKSQHSGRPLAIVVMGVSGSGKSTLGRLLADALNCPFIEGDNYHPPRNVAKMSAGIALQDEDRWPWLDALGRVIGSTAQERGIVVSACSALKRSYRERLRLNATVPLFFVCLEADPHVLGALISARTGHFMPSSLLESQLATLEVPDESEDAMRLEAGAPVSVLITTVKGVLADRLTTLPQRVTR